VPPWVRATPLKDVDNPEARKQAYEELHKTAHTLFEDNKGDVTDLGVTRVAKINDDPELIDWPHEYLPRDTTAGRALLTRVRSGYTARPDMSVKDIDFQLPNPNVPDGVILYDFQPDGTLVEIRRPDDRHGMPPDFTGKESPEELNIKVTELKRHIAENIANTKFSQQMGVEEEPKERPVPAPRARELNDLLIKSTPPKPITPLSPKIP